MRKLLTILCLASFSINAFCQTVTLQSKELQGKYYSSSSFDVIYSCQGYSGRTDVQVYVDGNLQQSQYGSKDVTPRNRSFTVNGLQENKLRPTSVRIVITGQNRTFLDQTYQLQYKDSKNRLCFLGLGIGLFDDRNGIQPLDWPAKDILRASDIVGKYAPNFYNVSNGPGVLSKYTEPEASWGTTGDVRLSFKRFESDLPADDKNVVFFYLSGHGEVSNGEWYFVTKDSRKNNISNTAFSGKELRDFIRSTSRKSHRVYLFVDACKSAALYPNPALMPSNLVFYASSREDESSYENKYSSFFTEAFCKAFTPGQAANQNGEITVKGLFDYITLEVGKNKSHVQHPVLMPSGKFEDQVLFKIDNKEDAPLITYSSVKGFGPMLMSLAPGVGQMYKKEYLKGGLLMGGTILGATGIVICEGQRQACASQLTQTHDINVIRQLQATQQNMMIARNVFIAVTALTYLYNLVDAAVAPGKRQVQLSGTGVVYNF